MEAIGLQVEQIVEHIDTRGAQAESDKSQQGSQKKPRPKDLMRREHRQRHKYVLHPLMDTESFGERLPCGLARKYLFERGDGRGLPAEPFAGVHDDSAVASSPDRDIRDRVSGIIKTLRAKALNQKGALLIAFEVHRIAGCHYARKNVQVLCDGLDSIPVRGSG